MKRVLAVIFLAAVVACAKKPAAEATTNTTAEAPPLPADVAAVSATAKTDTTDTTTTGASAIAEETGDTIVATGELVSPTRPALAVKRPGRRPQLVVEART